MSILRPVRGQSGSVATIVVVILSAIMAMTLSSVFVYLVNRAKWQAKIRETNKLTYVLEGLAKYTKEAYDRGAAVCAAHAGVCPANCTEINPPAPAPPMVTFCSGGACGTAPAKLLCFAPRPGASETPPNQVKATCPAGATLGIKYMNDEYCLVNGLIGTNTDQVVTSSTQDLSDPTIAARILFAAPGISVMSPKFSDDPIRMFESPARAIAEWNQKLQNFYGDLAQPNASRIIADFQAGKTDFVPEKFPFNLIGKAYAQSIGQTGSGVNSFIEVSPGDACPPNNMNYYRCGAPSDPSMASYLSSPAGQCVLATDQRCQRSCSATKKCLNIAVCPTFASSSSACTAAATTESMGLNVLINFN